MQGFTSSTLRTLPLRAKIGKNVWGSPTGISKLRPEGQVGISQVREGGGHARLKEEAGTSESMGGRQVG